MTLTVTRRAEQFRTTYRVDNADGTFKDSFGFREVMALIAAEQGRVHARWRRVYSPWYSDSYLHPECDDHGIGFGTIQHLQGGFRRDATIEPCAQEGPLGLTAYGREVLDAIKALNGVEASVPT